MSDNTIPSDYAQLLLKDRQELFKGHRLTESKDFEQLMDWTKELLLHDSLELIIPFFPKKNNSPIQTPISKSRRFTKYTGGLGIFSYVELSFTPFQEEQLILKDILPLELIDGYRRERPKHKHFELLQTIPFIFKAIVDYCLQYDCTGLQISLANIRFHPIDYRPFAYFQCAHLCMNDAFQLKKQ
ncbi:MAG: hypothetical protein GY810_31090 [Aureispira sp.]|nr:hypothetical protein [Aureispira sp.]